MANIPFDQAETNRVDFANSLRANPALGYPAVNTSEVQAALNGRYAAPNGLANLRSDLVDTYRGLGFADPAQTFEEVWQESQGNFELLVPLVLSSK